MGDRRTRGGDSTCGAVVAGSPSKRATRVRIPGGAIFGNFVEPTRGPVFCRGARFPNGFSIRKSIRKSDGTTMENPVLQFLMKSFGMEALTYFFFFSPRTRLKEASENDPDCQAGEQTPENASYGEKRKREKTESSVLPRELETRQC